MNEGDSKLVNHNCTYTFYFYRNIARSIYKENNAIRRRSDRPMYIDAKTIIAAASVLTALITIGSILIAGYKWFNRQNEQDVDIKKMKEEQCLLTYGVLACLKGMQEQGCNGPVTEAIDKIEKHINKVAHGQDP